MNKIAKALYEIEQTERRDPSSLRFLHPLSKLLAALLTLIFLTSCPRVRPDLVMALGLVPLFTAWFFDIPLKPCFRHLWGIFLLLLVMGGANLFLERQVIDRIGSLAVTQGMLSFLTLFLKGFYAVITTYLLIATTSFEDICYALQLLHVPALITTILLLIFRYLFVLMEEGSRMVNAYTLRAPKQKGVHFRAWGSFLGNLLLRSADRAKMVYESMELRGFSPEKLRGEKRPFTRASFFYLLVTGLLLAFLRFFPLFRFIGSLWIH